MEHDVAVGTNRDQVLDGIDDVRCPLRSLGASGHRAKAATEDLACGESRRKLPPRGRSRWPWQHLSVPLPECHTQRCQRLELICAQIGTFAGIARNVE
jgi:hypothetical protein